MRAHRRVPSHAVRILAAVTATLLFGGCAQEIGDIDRTQPNRVAKSALAGEWYMLTTVVDASATASSTFVGLQGDLERVAFSFEESSLIVRRTHEDYPGLESGQFNLTNPAVPAPGAAVAVFRINSHFDIQRSYNSSTGEQSNVISENSSDRPWFDREYIRVGWHQSELTTTNINSTVPIQASWFAPPPQDAGPAPDVFIEYGADGRANYIDTVVTYIVEPNWLDCVLTFGFSYDDRHCGPETVKIRNSFLRVDVEERADFVPRQFDNFDMNSAGFFRIRRCTFDRRHGCTDNNKVSLAALWNLWTNSRDDQGNARPYAERGHRPITYYVNTEFPIDLLGETFDAVEQWSFAFRRTVAALQNKPIEQVPRMFYMCLNPGTTDPNAPEEWVNQLYTEEQRNLLRAAYAASAEGYANGSCQRAGEVKNVGDLRYSMLNWVNNGAFVPWAGYGPSGQDPLSGETIQGAANINGQYYDQAAQTTMYLLDLVTGEISPEEYSSGDYLNGYFADLVERTQDRIYFGLNNRDKSLSGLQGQLRLPDGMMNRMTNLVTSNTRHREQLLETARDVMQRPFMRQLQRQPLSQLRARYRTQGSRLHRLAGTSVEERLVTPEIHNGLARQFELVPQAQRPQGEDLLNIISPARMHSARQAIRSEERMRNRLTSMNVCALTTDFDPYLLGFAERLAEYREELRQQGLSDFAVRQEVWREARARMYRGVMEHEIGHTIGLRHNFEGSFDALNFHPQYWRHRERTFNPDCDNAGFRTFNPDGLVTGNVAPERCPGGPAESPAAYAERSAQLLGELRAGITEDGARTQTIYEYMYSSIMDYDPKASTHSSGIGLYDYFAIAFGYGDLVEVFDEAPYRLAVDSNYNPTTDAFLSIDVRRGSGRVSDMRDVDDYTISRNGLVVGDDSGDDRNDNGWTFWHYSVLPMMFDGISDQVSSSFSSQFHPLMEFNNVGAMSGAYNRRLVPRSQLRANDVVVPYRFCSDEYNGSSSVCNTWDLGADEYEVFTTMKDTYDDYYISMFFRRGRPAFGLDLSPVVFGLMNRYYGKAISLYQYWLLDYSSKGFDWLNSPHGGLQQYLAAIDGVNFVASAFSTPTVGTYVRDIETGVWTNVSDEMDFKFEPYDPDYGSLPESGYMRVGVEDGGRYGFGQTVRNDEDERTYNALFDTEFLSHFWAKYAAIFAITAGDVDVVGVDTDSDSSAYYIPPYLAFGEDMDAFFGGMIAEDTNTVGQCVRVVDGERVIENLDMIRPSTALGCEADGGTLMNPYTAAYGNRDYNMQVFGMIFAASEFTAQFDTGWLDNSAVYIWGRGEQPELLPGNGPEFDWLTYTDETGTTYASRYRANLSAEADEQVTNVGRLLVQKLIDLQVQLDHACPYEFTGGADLELNCAMTETEASKYRTDNGRYDGEDFFSIRNDIERFRDLVRLQVQLNLVYNGW